MADGQLTAKQREFLELVSRAVFANPFSDDRAEIDLQIAGLSAAATRGQRLTAALARVRGVLADLDRAGTGDLRRLRGDDRHLVALAKLFDVFHEWIAGLDELIAQQITAGDESCPVTFADTVLDQLTRAGFEKREAVRYLAVFYQVRRAFHFVDRSLVGRSPSMKSLRRSLWNSVFTHDTLLYDRHLWNRMEDFSTLLLGETGTGKGAAASAIGRSGFIPFDPKTGRFAQSFMHTFLAINLSQFTESLIESELFGHCKGAFTGAVEAHAGIFSRCSPHGAIFLDEIGDVSIPIQIKLLQILQDRTFSPVGSHERERFHGRVIAASNRPIRALRDEGRFRDDFFYRLCSDIIVVPPLRQRLREDPSELGDLLAVTVTRIVGHESPELVDLVKGVIKSQLGPDYAWPGNVRELEQCVRRVLLTRTYEGDHAGAAGDLRTRIGDSIDSGTYHVRDLLADYCRLLYDRYGTYEEVARRTDLDRRTVKKHIVGD